MAAHDAPRARAHSWGRPGSCRNPSKAGAVPRHSCACNRDSTFRDYRASPKPTASARPSDRSSHSRDGVDPRATDRRARRRVQERGNQAEPRPARAGDVRDCDAAYTGRRSSRGGVQHIGCFALDAFPEADARRDSLLCCSGRAGSPLSRGRARDFSGPSRCGRVLTGPRRDGGATVSDTQVPDDDLRRGGPAPSAREFRFLE